MNEKLVDLFSAGSFFGIFNFVVIFIYHKFRRLFFSFSATLVINQLKHFWPFLNFAVCLKLSSKLKYLGRILHRNYIFDRLGFELSLGKENF